AALTDPDTTGLRGKIASAEETNRKVRENAQRASVAADAKAAADSAGDEKATDTKEDTKAADTKAADKHTTKKKKPAAPKVDGKPIYMKKCKSCHGASGAGDTKIGEKLGIPTLKRTKLSKSKLIKKIADGVPGTKMKAFKGKLSEDEIAGIAHFVKKL
ncbi:MAG: c-type cytochrome, partial [Nannocystaceae bacterium]